MTSTAHTQGQNGFEGIYVTTEAATYLTATLRRDVQGEWFYRLNSRQILSWIRSGLTSPGLAGTPGKDLILSFEDLVSMRVIAVMRSLGVSWPKIHRAENWLRQETQYPRPFAIQRVWTETVDVFAELPIGFVAASRHGQIVFPNSWAKTFNR